MATWHLLPPEIVVLIGQLVPAADLLSYALTCRVAFQVVRKRLQHNKQLHLELRIVHDRSPTTIPRLLRLVHTDKDVAWHVRILEIWGLRTGFDKWKSWQLSNGPLWNQGGPEPCEDCSNLAGDYFTDDERSRYADQLRSILQFSEEEVEQGMTDLLSGWDEPLKVMLIAVLPGLQRLNFIAYDTENIAFHHHSPLDMFANAIRSIQATLPIRGQWPVGFQSLRVINIGSDTKWRPRHHAHDLGLLAVACLFALPSIHTLTIRLMYSDAYMPPVDKLEPRSSSVQELALLQCTLRLDDLDQFLRAPRRLRKFMADAQGMRNDEEAWKTLVECHGQHLEFLSVAMIPTAAYAYLAQDLPNLKTLDGFNIKADVLGYDFRQILPVSLEKLYVCVKSGPISLPLLDAGSIWSALDNIVSLVETKRHTKLHTICLQAISEVSVWNGCNKDGPTYISLQEEQWYLDLIERIVGSGIETHLADVTRPEGCWPEWDCTAVHDTAWPTLQNLTEPRQWRREEMSSLMPAHQEH